MGSRVISVSRMLTMGVRAFPALSQVSNFYVHLILMMGAIRQGDVQSPFGEAPS